MGAVFPRVWSSVVGRRGRAGGPRRGRAPVDHEVAIVGTGFAGLGMAIQLLRAGRRSFVVFERAGEVGGTWRENHYPGCACDVPANLYSFSFEPNPRWSRTYAPQAELLAYLRHCADKYGVRPHLRFHTEIVACDWDEAGARWVLRTGAGETVTARSLVLGLGALSQPAFPDLPGLASFEGPAFHSAQWRHDVNLRGRRVAVIGAGASAIQFVPQIAPEAARVCVFQRTPPWVFPRNDRAVSARVQRLFAAVPPVQRAARHATYWRAELSVLGFAVHPRLMTWLGALGRRHLAREVADPVLREKLIPRYTPGCKRILLADDWYATLQRDNVEVVSDAIARVTPRGVVTADGVERAADVLIHGTGFRVRDLLTPVAVRGRGSADLGEAWRRGAGAYLGTTIAGFPNLYVLVGPNTGLGHSSMVFMIEAQIHHVMTCLRAMEQAGARSIGVRAEAQRRFVAGLGPRLERSVWASGCQSWYLDEQGQNQTLWPGFTVEFWLRSRLADAAHYELDVAGVEAA